MLVLRKDEEGNGNEFHVKSTDNLNLYDYVPEHSNVLRLLQSIDKIKQFRCYTKNK